MAKLPPGPSVLLCLVQQLNGPSRFQGGDCRMMAEGETVLAQGRFGKTVCDAEFVNSLTSPVQAAIRRDLKSRTIQCSDGSTFDEFTSLIGTPASLIVEHLVEGNGDLVQHHSSDGVRLIVDGCAYCDDVPRRMALD